jgi:TonB-dependent starch-binding outer membrane protein SusC
MRKFKIITGLLIFIACTPLISKAQVKPITGIVLDAKNRPVSGASILVVGKPQGTTTDEAGKFKLNSVPENGTLVISFAGYRTLTYKWDGTPEIKIELIEDIARLDEVVVTGLSTSVKRRNLANAVSTINATQLDGVAPSQTFDQALNGKIVGANITANTGAPGGGLTVKLRGVTSIYGNTQPLYVLDGVFVDNTSTSAGLNFVTGAAAGGSLVSTQDNPSGRISDINAEDIASVEILKGASAAAIYGSRAAGGVIIITTKKGRAGKTQVTFSQDLGFIKVGKLLGVRQFTAETAASLAGSDSVTGAKYALMFTNAKNNGQLYDYEKEIYGNTGFARNSLISVSGGNDRTTFYLSAGSKDETGIVKNTGYRNTSLRFNVDHHITDDIKIGISTNYLNTSANRGLSGNDNTGVTLGIALSSTPDFVQLHPDANGVYPNNPFAASNPLQTVALMQNNETVNRFITGLGIEAVFQRSEKSVTKFVAGGGLDFYNLQTKVLFPGDLQFQTVNDGTSIQGSTQNLNTNFILSLVNSYTASRNLIFTSSAGFTQENGNYNNILNAATHLIAGQSNIDQAGAITATQFRSQFQNQGFYAQEEASILDAITATIGVRFDRSTNNGDATKFYTYPKAGISWNLTHSGIMDPQGFFSNFKLRAAYGEANNTPAYGSKFTAMNVANIDGLTGAIIGLQKGNPDIEPERQSEFETGMDFSVLNGALSFELTYYKKNIYNFLMLTNPPTSSGFTSQWFNAGDLRNQGVELSLNARPVSTKNFVWNTTVSFWLNRSLVTRLVTPSTPQGSFGYVLGSYQIQQGQSATQILGLDGPNGVAKLGDAEPIFQMNTYNEITYQNKWSLRFLLHWKNGGQNVNLTALQNDFGQTSANFDQLITNPQTQTPIPLGYYRLSQVGYSAQQFVENSGYLKLREIGLYYSINTNGNNVIKGLQLGVSMTNFFVWTKYSSYDPEVSNFGTGFNTNVDVDPYPATKRADFHISVTF